MIAVLKVVTILATALFGIYASLVNFRDAHGRVTRHGWTGLIGVSVTGLLAAGLQVYADLKEREASEAFRAGVERTLLPLPGLTVSFALRPDWSKSGFRGYLPVFRKSFEKIGEATRGLVGKYETATAVGSHPYPQYDQHPMLDEALCGMNVELFVFRKPIATSDFMYALSNSAADLQIDAWNPCQLRKWASLFPSTEKGRFPLAGTGVEWTFDLRNGILHRFDLEVRDVAIDPMSNNWESNGRITSLHDLVGAQIIVQLVNNTIPSEPAGLAHRRAVQLAELLIRLPGGVVLRFDHDNLDRFPGHQGLAAYEIKFPSRVEELIEETRYEPFKKLYTALPPIQIRN